MILFFHPEWVADAEDEVSVLVCQCYTPLSAGTWEAQAMNIKVWVLGVSISFPGINLQKLFYGCPEQEGAGSGSGQKQDGIGINSKPR